MLNHKEEVFSIIRILPPKPYSRHERKQHSIKMDWVISAKAAFPFVFNSFVVSYLYGCVSSVCIKIQLATETCT